MQLQGYDLVGLTETWWDGPRGWSLAMEGHGLSRCGGSGGKRAPAQQHVEEESLGFVLRRFPRPLPGEQGLCSADLPLSHADLSAGTEGPRSRKGISGASATGMTAWDQPLSIERTQKPLHLHATGTLRVPASSRGAAED